MKLTRRGLFTLGIGSALAALVGKGAHKNATLTKAGPNDVYRGVQSSRLLNSATSGYARWEITYPRW